VTSAIPASSARLQLGIPAAAAAIDIRAAGFERSCSSELRLGADPTLDPAVRDPEFATRWTLTHDPFLGRETAPRW
jgi:hypothetical protein